MLGHISKLSAKKEATQAVTAQKEAIAAELTAEADTFRGVHLDPNAHHWDEVGSCIVHRELGGVIKHAYR